MSPCKPTGRSTPKRHSPHQPSLWGVSKSDRNSPWERDNWAVWSIDNLAVRWAAPIVKPEPSAAGNEDKNDGNH